jgi:8-oxo-dGTP pyrophosphatase MutT (NUDIX family)
MTEYLSAAGIIVYRSNPPGNLLFLGLIALPRFQTKNNGIYDIPKGRIDPGETPLQCAIREAQEEATIDITHLDSGPFFCDRLTVWLAESFQEPCVGINPVTGLKEHLGYRWVSGDILESQCLDYLKPHIQWARKYLGDA